ncbi:MAG: hypothetical protein KGY60_09270 [Bacteroidales bacterium]|nr:hypothetical protein [Bacteroidales bacterium]
MMKDRLLIALFLLLPALQIQADKIDQPTEVLVLGTIHSSHAKNPNYSYENVIHILDAYQPEAVCVEIRPRDFRKNPSLREMELASIYGLANNIPVYPIDWWRGNARHERREYVKTDEYLQKKAQAEQLRKESRIIQHFEQANGSWHHFRYKKGYRWWNGKEYNDYHTQGYRISMEVYGDHCMNLYYRTRNDSMMALIDEAIASHRGERIVVVTGAEHKHYFDRALDERDHIETVNLNSLTIEEKPVQKEAIKKYLAGRDPSIYLLDATPEKKYRWIRSAGFTPLLHGPDMDFHPYSIPQENIEKASRLLERLEEEYGRLPDFVFEKGWVDFLKGHYDRSIAWMKLVVKDSANVSQEMKYFLIPSAIRTQAYCHDLKGNRRKALELYNQAKTTALRYGDLPEWKRNVLYDRWMEKPYTHEKE